MAERPVECSQCKKPIKTLYKEIAKGIVLATDMCADCPVLQERLHGSKGEELSVACPQCKTTKNAILMGNPIGCNNCYTVFADLITLELIKRDKLKMPADTKKNLHVGSAPGIVAPVAEQGRLSSLNAELAEALKKENYEQAAWIRDQIKKLMEGGS